MSETQFPPKVWKVRVNGGDAFRKDVLTALCRTCTFKAEAQNLELLVWIMSQHTAIQGHTVEMVPVNTEPAGKL